MIFNDINGFLFYINVNLFNLEEMLMMDIL